MLSRVEADRVNFTVEDREIREGRPGQRVQIVVRQPEPVLPVGREGRGQIVPPIGQGQAHRCGLVDLDGGSRPARIPEPSGDAPSCDVLQLTLPLKGLRRIDLDEFHATAGRRQPRHERRIEAGPARRNDATERLAVRVRIDQIGPVEEIRYDGGPERRLAVADHQFGRLVTPPQFDPTLDEDDVRIDLQPLDETG